MPATNAYDLLSKIFTISKSYYLDSIVGYLLIFLLTYLGLYLMGWVELIPGNATLGKFDVGFYRSIKDDGYIYQQGQKCNAGFFPLFAYLWKISCMDKMGMALLNGLIFLGSLAFLCRLLQPDRIVLGFFLSSPFMFFMYTPLTEPLFFFCCTLIIYGLVKEHYALLFGGIFLASMTRASFLFFIPAFVGMTLLAHPVQQALSIRLWKDIFLRYLLPCLLGVVVVLVIQWMQTGKWGAYFDIQHQVWERQFNWPTFPLYRNGPAWVFRWSLLSLWVGIFASGWGLTLLWQWIKGKALQKKWSSLELFALIYITMSLISVVFFNPKWAWFGQFAKSVTYLGGINRYIHVHAFFLVLLLYFYERTKVSNYQLAGLVLGTQILWLIIEPTYWDHIAKLWRVSIVTLMLLPFWIYHKTRWPILGYGIILVGFAFQVILFNFFMASEFVD